MTGASKHRTRWIAAVLVTLACLGAAALYVHYRPTSPTRSDIDETQFVAYPESTLVKDVFQRAESGRYIDTGSFTHPTQLIRRYKLQTPITLDVFMAWLRSTYPRPGWTSLGSSDANRIYYGTTVGKRKHRLTVMLFGVTENPVSEYEVTYSVR